MFLFNILFPQNSLYIRQRRSISTIICYKKRKLQHAQLFLARQSLRSILDCDVYYIWRGSYLKEAITKIGFMKNYLLGVIEWRVICPRSDFLDKRYLSHLFFRAMLLTHPPILSASFHMLQSIRKRHNASTSYKR